MTGLVQVSKTHGFLPKSVLPDFLRLYLAGFFYYNGDFSLHPRSQRIKLFKSKRAFFLQLFSECPICFSIWFYICSVIGEEPTLSTPTAGISLPKHLSAPPSLPPPPSPPPVNIIVELKDIIGLLTFLRCYFVFVSLPTKIYSFLKLCHIFPFLKYHC